MAVTDEQYLRQLQALLPSGPAWPRDADSVLTKLLSAWAAELSRIDSRGDALVDEADPRTAFELLDDWERNTGLPDPCVGSGQGTQQRRGSLLARITDQGGQSIAHFVAVAEALGFSVTVTEFRPYDVGMDVSVPLYGDDWAYAWQINGGGAAAGAFSVSDGVDDDLGYSGTSALTCTVDRLKPAHTTVLYNFT